LKRYFIHGSLFLATLITTFAAGYFLYRDLADGIMYASALVLILGSHEFGHYYFGRKYGVDMSPPYFIPAPVFEAVPTIGTFGAFIKIRSPIYTKRALFDIGVAGPLVGVIVALPIIAIGLKLSNGLEYTEGFHLGSYIGFPLIYSFLVDVFIQNPSVNPHYALHPLAFAGWLGLLVTALNLMPAGQLDGGHIVYSLFPRKWHGRISVSMIVVLLFMGLGTRPFIEIGAMIFNDGVIGAYGQSYIVDGWPGWLLWAALLTLIGRGHPPTLYEDVPLDRKRKLVAVVALLLFIGCFTPVPLRV